MERAILVNISVLCVFALFLGAVRSIPHNYDTTSVKKTDENEDNNNKDSYLWFGPRLGRKKRNNGDDSYRTSSSSIDREQLEALMDVIHNSPWAIVAVNEGKRHTVNFTPRLGRESGEDFISGASSSDQWMQDSEMSGELISQRSPPFAPRLGRRMSPYSPRLGRENDKLHMS